ncbi:MAG: porin [Emcibacteraceae bacterium]|nr:porin [Emcibacteraceae bacterium]
MNTLKLSSSLLVLSIAMGATSTFAQDMPSQAEMWEIVKKQQKQIEMLQQQLGQTNQVIEATTEKVEIADQKIEATVIAMEDGISNSGGGNTSSTTLGGYGELHFNAGEADQIDFHRFVLFVGHEFNERIRFFSELEVEHSLAGDGKPGEVELEQAFVEFDMTDNTTATVGLQLVPVGILNETHEPPTFYGVERNNVEKNIIPATWWEAGVKFSGNVGEKIRYDAMLHSGLETDNSTGGSPFNIRSGRQKVAKATWKNAAYTGRVTFMPTPGVTLAASIQYQSDLTQSSSEPTSAVLLETHAVIERQISVNNQVSLRALYAQWKLNSTKAELLGKDIQRGWYIEPSFKHNLGGNQAVGFFARYSMWDNTAGDDVLSANKQTSFGVNYWPHQNVVLKADYQIDNYANELSDDSRVNLGIGVQF